MYTALQHSNHMRIQCQEYKEKYGWAPENNRKMLKWSFADSPYCAYGEQYFTDVQKMIDERDLDIGDDEEDDEKFMEEYEFRMDSMEKVMSDLDKEGIFGSGEKRIVGHPTPSISTRVQ